MESGLAKQLCEELMHADAETDIIDILEAAGYWSNPDCWRYYGDNELNWSQAGGQQGRADFALNEKAINSIDAVLTLKCLQAGISPESAEAPASIRAAVARFFENAEKLTTTAGRVEDWPSSVRTKVAENISIFTTEAKGSKSGSKPSVNIADMGEGHTPEAFPNTFVSLGKRNKASVAFVQGKFCQGGSGAIRHCGSHKLQLVISRRHPDLIESPHVAEGYKTGIDADCWGFTIVRREEATANSKIPVLTYLAPMGAKNSPRRGEVLRFAAKTMPIFPKGDTAYARDVQWGTLMKLYSYQLKSVGNIIRRDGLLYKLDLLLPDPALPIRLAECRPRARGIGASEQTTTMSGLFARLHENENLEDAPPMSMMLTIQGCQLSARVFAFKPLKGATYRSTEGVIFTVNGQAHADIKAAFFARKRIGLQRLAKDLLVVVDCSSLDANQRDDLFMSSRDRVAEESPLFAELEHNLEDALRDHPGLRELRNKRAQQDLEDQLSDDKPLESVLKKVLRSSPALAKLFGRGERLSSPFKQSTAQADPEPPVLHTHPTFFHFGNKDAGELLKRTANLGQRCRIGFVTDAEDSYFTRKYDAGSFQFRRLLAGGAGEPVLTFNGPNLVKGRASLSFDLPQGSQVEDLLEYEAIVHDEIMQRSFVNRFTLKVSPEVSDKLTKPGAKASPRSDKPGKLPDGQGGISLPNVVRLSKADDKWPQHFDDDADCLAVIEDPVDVNGREQIVYSFYLNEDNTSLQTELKASKKGSAEVLKKQFEIGAVLVGLALIHDHTTHKAPLEAESTIESEQSLVDRIKVFSRAVAPVLLPMIQALSEIGADDIDQSDTAGEAVEFADLNDEELPSVQ